MISRQTIITSVLVVLLAYEVVVLILLALFPYVTDPGFVALNNIVYTFLAPLSTVLLLGVLYSWFVELGAREARNRSTKFSNFLQFIAGPFQKIIASVKTASVSNMADSLPILSRPWLVLIISLVASVLLAFAPYRPDLNPTGTLVGVDSPLYVGWLNQMLARPLPQAIQYSFVQGLDGSRPLLLIPLYLVAAAGVSSSTVVEYLPMILAPLLSISIYIFVRYGQGSARLAALASIFTPFSFYTTIGLWGGYYANWLGLILSYMFMTCLLSFSKRPTAFNYAMMFILSVGLFLTHPWTWVLILTVALVFAISLHKDTKNRVHVESIIAIIATGVVLDLFKSWAFATRSVAADIATKTPNVVGWLPGFWKNLVQALLYTHDGLMADWLILLLGLVAVFTLRFKDRFERLLLQWVTISSIPFLIFDSYNQSRIIYDLPIPPLVGVVTVTFASLLQARRAQWPRLVVLVILFTIASYSVQGILRI